MIMEFHVLKVEFHSSLSSFLQHPAMEVLQQFLPIETTSLKAITMPLLLVQLNFFDCGGLAMDLCISHSFAVAYTLCPFIKDWAAIAPGRSQTQLPLLQFDQPSSFRPIRSLGLLLPWTDFERYVFSASKTAALKAKVVSTSVRRPSRTEAVTALLWNCAMAAKRSNTQSRVISKQYALVQYVNLRKRVVPSLPEKSIGSLVLGSTTTHVTDESETGLQDLDQTQPPIYGLIIFFYSADDTKTNCAYYSKLLKNSLSQTLTSFYPMAGRLHDDTSVDCNEEGALIVEANIACNLSDILTQPEAELLNHFLPTNDPKTLDLAPGCIALIQLTSFQCGGIAISVCLSHKLTDVSSRSMTGSSSSSRPSVLFQAVDLRRRMKPPLPDNSIGNLFWVLPVVINESEMDLRTMVWKMKEAVDEFSKIATKFKGEEGFSIISEFFKGREVFKEMERYSCTSWCKFPLYETDFGFGKPVWVSSTTIAFKNTIVLVDTKQGDGIEAWVTLEEENMSIFE